ncbi:cytochrome P450 2J6-like [Mytilus edulis]|uniref:cytochrome P450 2J6-like n=1 Tax=Mytilus edulis TaxID=6550 RepID=UPI0039EF05B3
MNVFSVFLECIQPTYVSVFILILIVSLCYTVLCWRRPSDLPPGPKFYPIIGNMRTVGQKTLVGAFRDWRKEFGDIFSVSLGSKWVIVICGLDNLKEAFVERDDVFSDRPDLFVNRYINEKRGIIGSDGEKLKELKRFTLRALREFGFGKGSLEENIQEEVNIFLDFIDETNGTSFSLDEKVNVSISNIICSIVFGKRYEYDDHKFVKLMKILDDYISNSTLTTVLNFIPNLRHLPGDIFSAKKVLSNQKEIEEFIQARIDEHKSCFDSNNITDFIDACLREMETRNETSITESEVRKIIRDLFIAGTQTTAACIKWFILYMIHYPDIQEKMWREIDSVTSSNRLLSLNDRSKLQYCQAVVDETLRISNTAPLSVLHGASNEIFFKGFRIPKGSVIVPNIDSVLMDERVFSYPEKFNPERFLDKDGMLHGTEKNIAFSVGRRACMGESLARMELFLYLTALVQRFKFLPACGEDPPPKIKRILGLQFTPAPFMLKVARRF